MAVVWVQLILVVKEIRGLGVINFTVEGVDIMHTFVLRENKEKVPSLGVMSYCSITNEILINYSTDKKKEKLTRAASLQRVTSKKVVVLLELHNLLIINLTIVVLIKVN
ncbi:hypothetical protein DGG96_03625 [Legionella qingyii]|uniref:Uncharacterized protein n=1 Tax=Legionella qingyii TaxID=2184757 RepID=A0A317U7C2_9GAMM|nr:hypothetical protein DGG96_03625 [Legionella qingyii]